MEEDKEPDNSKLMIDNDFLSLLQNEIPNLKIATVPITKDDIKDKSMIKGYTEGNFEKSKVQRGFFEVLGISKRNLDDQE
jgi:hypothetical protein